jgi:hypothetical protein
MLSIPPPDNPQRQGPTPSLDYGESRIGLIQSIPAPSRVASLIGQAPRTRCQNNAGLFIVSAISGVAFELTCGRWDCPAPGCGGLKRRAAREVLTGGLEAAWDRGERARLITLTAPPAGMNMRQVYDGWNRVKAALKHHGMITDYAGTIESQKRRGGLHLHLLTTGEFIPQKRLSEIAQGRPGSAGRFGPVVDIRAVRNTGRRSAAAYLLKQVADDMAGYVAKAAAPEHARLRLISPIRPTRLRPLRLSRGWYPGGLSEAARVIRSDWSAGAAPIQADDWQVWRLDHRTGQPTPLDPAVTAPAAIETIGLPLATDTGPVLLQAA